MTEAVGATIEAAFSIERPLNRFLARIDRRNDASARIAGKIGLIQEGMLR